MEFAGERIADATGGAAEGIVSDQSLIEKAGSNVE